MARTEPQEKLLILASDICPRTILPVRTTYLSQGIARNHAFTFVEAACSASCLVGADPCVVYRMVLRVGVDLGGHITEGILVV